jgi:ribonuclease HII
MERYGKLYPGYGYEKHKGYPTKEHRAAIMKHGPSPIQRMSFNMGTGSGLA